MANDVQSLAVNEPEVLQTVDTCGLSCPDLSSLLLNCLVINAANWLKGLAIRTMSQNHDLFTQWKPCCKVSHGGGTGKCGKVKLKGKEASEEVIRAH
jgi:hypothetical protein